MVLSPMFGKSVNLKSVDSRLMLVSRPQLQNGHLLAADSEMYTSFRSTLLIVQTFYTCSILYSEHSYFTVKMSNISQLHNIDNN